MSLPERLLDEQNIEFPVYRLQEQGTIPYKIVDDLLFINNTPPVDESGELKYRGKVGAEYTVEEGYEAARLAGMHVLRLIKDALGSLDRVDYLLKSMVMVSAPAGFSQIYKVADGFSDLMTEAFGERGLHTRNAIGASTLNDNAPLICDLIVKIK